MASWRNSEKKHPAWVDLVAGGSGGALAKSLLSPFQRIVVMQQLGQHRGLSFWGLLRHISDTEGLTGFWRGNFTSMLIRIPYSGIQFLLYSQLKFFLQDQLASRRYRRKCVRDENCLSYSSSAVWDLLEKFILKCGAGGVSAIVAGAAVYPGEVIRLRLMSGERQFRGIGHTCRLIYRETHSLRNFYRGLGASLIQRVPDILVSFATYETVKYGLLDKPHGTLFPESAAMRNVFATVIGGSAAALASIVVTFPLDVAKRRIGMSGKGKDTTVYAGVVDCLSTIYRKEGMRGWYAGATVEAVRCVPQVVLMWFFIEAIQKGLTERYTTHGPSS